MYYPYNELLFRGSNVFWESDDEELYERQPDWLAEILLSEKQLYWKPIKDDDVAFVYARTIPYFASLQEKRAVLAIEAERETLAEIMGKSINSQVGFLGIVSDHGDIIVDIPSEECDLEPDEAILKEISEMSGDGFFKGKTNGEEYMAFYASSEYNDWKYISLLYVDDIFAGSWDIKILLLFFCMLFTCLNVVAAVFLTKKAHRPMEYIVNNIKSYLGGDNSIGEMKNQYELLEQTFRSLAFQVKDLNEHLVANQPIIYHNMIKRILVSEERDVYRDTEIIDFKKEFFCCYLIQIDHSMEMNIHNKMMINYSVIDLLNSQEDWYDLYSITDENNLIYGIINFSKKDQLPSIVNHIEEELCSSISTKFIICLGNIVENEKDIADSYKKVLEVKKYIFFSINKKRLYYDQLQLKGLKTQGSAEKILEKVRTELRKREWDQAKETIWGIIEIVSDDFYDADYRMNTLSDLVSTVRNVIITFGLDENYLFGGDIREQLKSIYDISQFKEWIDEILTILEETDSNKNGASIGDLKQKIEQYVEENIFKDLTLTNMSEALCISPSYLSRIFKTIIGMNCSEYLVEAKLKKAKDLLFTTNDTVKEIAEKLGYSSSAHFIRIFKSYYGITPKQMQKRGKEME